MADISSLSIKIFVEARYEKNGKRVLYIVLKVTSNKKIKNILPFPFKAAGSLYFFKN
jgi:hypothetical protein